MRNNLTDIQERAEKAGTLGILVLGTGVCLQILYAAFALFGEKVIRPADLLMFTEEGQSLYLPEREIPLYVIGCLLTLLLVPLLHRVWRKRLNQVSPDERAVFALAHGLENLVLALSGTLGFFALIFVERKALHRLPLSLAATFLYFALEIAVFAWVFKRSRTLFTAQAQRWIAGQSSAADSRPFSNTDSAAHTPVSKESRTNRVWDVVVPVALFLLIWVPNVHRQAGFVYTVDRFHHWDYFVMAPAVGYTHGGALGTQVYAQYGLGWPVLFAILAPLLPLSYGHLIFGGMVYALLYFLGVYACLRYLFRDGKWAAGGVCIAYLLMAYISDINNSPWLIPSSTCLRSPCDIWLFFTLLVHARTRRASALYASALLTGLALLFETDTGVYLNVVFGIYLFYYPVSSVSSVVVPEEARGTKQKGAAGKPGVWWRTCAVCGSIVLAVLLASLWVASRGTLFQSGFVVGWLEVFWEYPSGISLLPIFSSWAGVCLSFLFISTYVSVGAWALICRQERRATGFAGWLLSVSVFGMLYMLQFIGRSFPFTLFHVSLPLSLLLILGIKAFADTFLSSAQAGAPNPTRRVLSLLGWALAGLLLPGMLLLGMKPGILPMFRRFPSMLLDFNPSSPPVTQEMLPATHDALLPDEYAEEVQQFNQTAQEIHRLTAQGRRVAIVSNDDTALYLASDTPLWCRYSPVLPGLLTTAQATQVASQLAAPGTDYVYILRYAPLPSMPKEQLTTDSWIRLHDVVAAHYRRDHIIGKYEVWRR